jgi:GT2 family glycosyltransferase
MSVCERVAMSAISSEKPASGLPLSLVLVPTSRWPTELPAATKETVLGQPLAPLQPLAADAMAAGTGPRVSVVIVTFNSLVFTRMCLESLLANTDAPQYEILVVDNASTDATVAYLEQLALLHPHVRVLKNTHNRGFAPANNQALREARGEIFILLNNDTIVPPGWLTGLISHLDQPAVGLVGPVTNRTGNEAEIEVPYRTYGELVQFAATYTRAHQGEVFDIGMLAMFCVALRREVLERVGPLDECFEIGLFEDDDYAQRVRAAGLRVMCAEDVFVHHFGQASIGHLAVRGKYGELFHENRRRWEAKWHRAWQPYQRRPKPSYQQLTQRIRRAVAAQLPPGETVLVISKGDDELLDLDGRPAWHFPQGPDGAYAGYYPPDSAAAIAHLEALRAREAAFLLLPSTSLWWLDFYGEFRQHLEQHYPRIVNDESTCVIFALRQRN